MTTDPKGTVDGTNLYSFVKNNPINATDPTGKQSNEQNQTVQNLAPDPKGEDAIELKPVGTRSGSESPISAHYKFPAMQVKGNISELKQSTKGGTQQKPQQSAAQQPSTDQTSNQGGQHLLSNPLDIAAELPYQTAGQGMIALYSADRRFGYMSQIKTASIQAESRILDIAAESGDLLKQRQIAINMSKRRNSIRRSMQERLFGGSQSFSEELDVNSSRSSMHFLQKAIDDSSGPRHSTQTYLKLVEKAGKSRGSIKTLAYGGKALGFAGTVLGLAGAASRYRNAPEGQGDDVIVEETLGILGGAIGAEAGTAVGAALGLSGGGVIALAVGGSIVVGAGGAKIGEMVGRVW
jgi:hypothetical protein